MDLLFVSLRQGMLCGLPLGFLGGFFNTGQVMVSYLKKKGFLKLMEAIWGKGNYK